MLPFGYQQMYRSLFVAAAGELHLIVEIDEMVLGQLRKLRRTIDLGKLGFWTPCCARACAPWCSFRPRDCPKKHVGFLALHELDLPGPRIEKNAVDTRRRVKGFF